MGNGSFGRYAVVIVILLMLFWAIGSCSRMIYDPFDGHSTASVSSSTAGSNAG